MNEKKETIKDILDGLLSKDSVDALAAIDSAETVRILLEHVASRIEAAAEREVRAREQAAADYALKRGEDIHADRCRNCTERAPGNAAALRKALEGIADDCRVLDRKDMWEEEGECYYDALRDIREKVNTALSAPARNCDKMTEEEALAAWEKYRHSVPLPIGGWDFRHIVKWLFAPAEGGAE